MELFALGTFWFWVLVIVANLMLITAVEWRSGWCATATFLVSLGCLQWFGDLPIFSLILHKPLVVFPLLAAYFGVGTFWTVGKWWFFVTDQRRRYDDRKVEYLRRVDIRDWSELNATQKADFAREIRYEVEVPPQARNHKADIYLWIAAWPWSMTWTLINDPVTRLCRFIYNHVAGTLNKISAAVFAGTEEDLK